MRTTSDVTLEGELKSGKYGVVRSLLRVLEGGTASKALLDSVIDACKYDLFLCVVLYSLLYCTHHHSARIM